MAQRTVVRLTLAVSLLAGLSACCPVPKSFLAAGDSVTCHTEVYTPQGETKPKKRVVCEGYDGASSTPTRGHTSGVGEG